MSDLIKVFNMYLNKMAKYCSLLVSLFVSINATAGVIFSDNFESGDLSHSLKGANWGNDKNVSVTSDVARAGSKSLRLFFEAKGPEKPAHAELRFDLGGNYDEVWLKYDLLVPANYNHRKEKTATNNKFVYFWSGDYSAKFTGPGLSIQNWAIADGESKAVPKAKGPPKSGGGYLFDKYYHSDGGNIFEVEDYGKWITIVIHVKYASASNDDGVSQLWKIRDGKTIQVFDKTDGNWYAPGQPGFDQGYLFGWANAGFNEDTYFHIDNVEFSTSPLLDGIDYISDPRPAEWAQ